MGFFNFIGEALSGKNDKRNAIKKKYHCPELDLIKERKKERLKAYAKLLKQKGYVENNMTCIDAITAFYAMSEMPTSKIRFLPGWSSGTVFDGNSTALYRNGFMVTIDIWNITDGWKKNAEDNHEHIIKWTTTSQVRKELEEHYMDFVRKRNARLKLRGVLFKALSMDGWVVYNAKAFDRIYYRHTIYAIKNDQKRTYSIMPEPIYAKSIDETLEIIKRTNAIIINSESDLNNESYLK